MPTTPYTFRMDADLRKSLELEAQFEDRPAAQLANHAIKAMVEAKVAKRQAIEQALDQANSGVFISQESMNNWMDSWDSDNELPSPEPDITPTQP